MNGLIEHVPRLDSPAIVPHHALDMSHQLAFSLARARDLFGPGWHRTIPNKSMAACRHAVSLGEREDSVGVAEPELLPGWAQVLPTEHTLGRELLAVIAQCCTIGGLPDKHRRPHGSPERHTCRRTDG